MCGVYWMLCTYVSVGTLGTVYVYMGFAGCVCVACWVMCMYHSQLGEQLKLLWCQNSCGENSLNRRLQMKGNGMGKKMRNILKENNQAGGAWKRQAEHCRSMRIQHRADYGPEEGQETAQAHGFSSPGACHA